MCLTIRNASAENLVVLGLASGNQVLFQIDSASPSAFSPPVPIAGLAASEQINVINYRPNNGLLYGLTNQDHIYNLNPLTGAATLTATTSSSLGFVGAGDFDPVADRLRVSTNSGLNARINVDTGQTIIDSPLAFVAGDVNFGRLPVTGGLAFTNSFAGAASTTLYGAINPIGAATTTLAIVSNQNAGALVTVGNIAGTGGISDLDISGVTSTAYATTAANQLFTLNLNSGAATLIGTVTGGPAGVSGILVSDIAAPVGTGSQQPIPEPTTILLLGSGFAALMGYGWRQRLTNVKY